MLVEIDDEAAERLIVSTDPALREIGCRFFEAKARRRQVVRRPALARLGTMLAELFEGLRDQAAARLDDKAMNAPQRLEAAALPGVAQPGRKLL